MESNKTFENFGSKPQWKSINHNKFPFVFTSSANSVTVYTVLTILSSMKTQVGLEAMLEYLEIYLSTVNIYNPDLKEAVARVLMRVNLEKLYREARRQS